MSAAWRRLVGNSSPRASSGTPTAPSSSALKDVLTEDFRQQCTNLQNQYTRMHGRMQLITGLNSTLLPALGALAVAAGRDDVGYGWLLLFPAAGMLLSAIGYVAGANDRYLVELYRKQLARTAESLLRVADAETPYNTWAHAGRDPREVSDIVGKPRSSLTSWRWDAVSVTRLPALLSLVFFSVDIRLAPVGSYPARNSASPEHLALRLPLTVSLDTRKRWSAQWWAGPHTLDAA